MIYEHKITGHRYTLIDKVKRKSTNKSLFITDKEKQLDEETWIVLLMIGNDYKRLYTEEQFNKSFKLIT